jgi:hypothetical protein
MMAECAYCAIPFAEVRSPYQRLTVIDGRLPDAWERAEAMMLEWQENGELDREVIVDRRHLDEDIDGPDRRRLAGAGLPVRIHSVN